MSTPLAWELTARACIEERLRSATRRRSRAEAATRRDDR